MTAPIQIQTSGRQPMIKLQFDRGDDRWKHRLTLVEGNSELGIMTSIEGTPDDNWPPSAPLQDVSRHSLEQGDAILCVGMAGKSHWSASYSVESHSQTSGLKADMACLQKVQSAESKLGSKYTLDANCQIKSFNENRIQLRINDNQSLTIEALVGDDFQTILELDERTLSIRPSQISTSPVVATRWGFVAS